uniref:Uncharacterized protein n=1 Tax=Ditylenchus dipsaci TaxID=166011 RepID=A0A915DIX4_9BILA
MLFLVIALLVVSAGALQWKMMDGGKYSATTALASPGQADIFLQNAQIYCVSKPNRLPTQVDLWDADKPSYLSTHNITNNTLDFEAYMDKGLFTFTSQWYLNFSQQTCNPDRPTDLELKFPEVSAKMKTYISGVLVVLDQWSEPQKSGVFVIAGRIKCAGGDQISSAHVTGIPPKMLGRKMPWRI